MSKSTYPAQVYIIRHGEKLGSSSDDKSGGPNLSIRGAARAAALPSLFVDATKIDCKLTADTPLAFGGCYNAPTNQGGRLPLAKPDLLVANSPTSGQPPRLAKPDFLFASQASGDSNRPVETITPLSVALQLEIDTKHPSQDHAKVAADILTNAKYAGKTVLICWHHSTIPALANELINCKGKMNLTWSSEVFDQIWQITYPNGMPTFQVLAQMLLYGD